MEAAERLTYMNDITQEAQTFADRLKALLANTWDAMGTQGWMVIIAVAVGAVVGILLVWFIAKIIIALAYSLVGTATIFLGTQAALLGAGYHAVSSLDAAPGAAAHRLSHDDRHRLGLATLSAHRKPRTRRPQKSPKSPRNNRFGSAIRSVLCKQGRFSSVPSRRRPGF